jgi:UDP-N-acetylbacillosamine N-acetyltransferase
MENLIIIGAGGHGRVAADCARSMKAFSSIQFLDENFPERTTNLDWSIIGKSDEWSKYKKDAVFFVAIGNNEQRMKLLSILKADNVKITNLIHPNATLSKTVEIGVGNCVFAHAVVNAATVIADGCIINTSATIDHDGKLNNGVHISPGANLAGQVEIGKLTWIGIGANVIQGISIAQNVIIGAGSTVIRNINNAGTFVGLPARKIK